MILRSVGAVWDDPVAVEEGYICVMPNFVLCRTASHSKIPMLVGSCSMLMLMFVFVFVFMPSFIHQYIVISFSK